MVRRVLMLSYPFPPAMSGGVFRTLRFCKYLPEFGWEPLVLTPRAEAVFPITLDPSLDALVPSGLQVVRTGVLRPNVTARKAVRNLKRRFVKSSANNNATVSPASSSGSDTDAGQAKQLSTLRKLEQALFETPDRHIGWLPPAVRAGMRIIRRQRPDVIYSTGPPHSTHLIAVTLKRLTGLPVVLDFRDPWSAREWSANQRLNFHQRMTACLERRCLAAADRIVVNTAAVKRQFESVYSAEVSNKTAVIPNGIDPALSQRIERLVETAGSNCNGCIRLCHAGSAYGKRDLRPLAEALKLVADGGQAVSMEQVGPVDPRFRPRCVPDGANHLKLLGSLPHEEALARMSAANILVLIQPDNTLQIPGKLYEMLPFRKPILALAGRGATADVVDQYGLGRVVAPTDPAAIAEGIRWAASESGQRSVAEGARRAMAAFDGRALTNSLAMELQAATSK